jgi:hypothetical protein
MVHDQGVDSAEAIWNRAALEHGGPSPGPGDAALSAVLAVHSLAMSGGLLDAVERLAGPALDDAESGCRWLGLPDAAAVIAFVRDEIRAGALSDGDRADDLEIQAGQRYADVIPCDATLIGALRLRLAEDPAAFAGTSG